MKEILNARFIVKAFIAVDPSFLKPNPKCSQLELGSPISTIMMDQLIQRIIWLISNLLYYCIVSQM